jgi:hypothetical protein
MNDLETRVLDALEKVDPDRMPETPEEIAAWQMLAYTGFAWRLTGDVSAMAERLIAMNIIDGQSAGPGSK